MYFPGCSIMTGEVLISVNQVVVQCRVLRSKNGLGGMQGKFRVNMFESF